MVYKSADEAQVYDKEGNPLYGLDAELYLKQQSKNDVGLEQQAREWIEAVTGGALKSADTQEALKDGVTLCNLANKIRPGVIAKINNSRLPFMQMENISSFLKAIDTLGVSRSDQFQTVDLFEGKNMPQVIQTIHKLGSVCQKVAPQLPKLGVKVADKKEITFSEQQLREAANASSWMYSGSKKIDTGVSISREIVKTKDAGDRGAVSQQSSGSVKQDTGRSIANEVVKTKDAGDRGAVSQQSSGSVKQDTGRSISNEIVKVKDVGDRSAVSQQSSGSVAHEPQRSISNEIVKIKPAPGAPGSSSSSSSAGSGNLEDLEKLAQLRDKGIITEDEFLAKKMQILGL